MTDPKNATLFRATGRLLRERGFSGTSIRAIAKAADMLPGSVTYRYATKDELVIAMLRYGMQNATTVLREALATTEGNPQERNRAILTTMLRLLASDSNAAWLLRHEWDRLPESVRDALQADVDAFETFTWSVLEQGAEAGVVRRDLDLNILKRILEGATTAAATLIAEDPDALDKVAWSLSEVIANGMFNPTAEFAQSTPTPTLTSQDHAS